MSQLRFWFRVTSSGLFAVLLSACTLQANNVSKIGILTGTSAQPIPTTTPDPNPTSTGTPLGSLFSYNWDLNIPGNFTVSDPTRVAIGGGVAALTQIIQTDQDNTALGYGGGTLQNVIWNAGSGWIQLDGTNGGQFFPNGSTRNAGWFDMTGNTLLYHFEEGSSATMFTDSSSTANVASCSTCPTRNQSTKFGKGLFFSGTATEVVQVPVSMEVNSQTTCSISVWFKTLNNLKQTIFSMGDGSTQGMHLYTETGFVSADNASGGLAASNIKINDNNWHHAVWVWDAAGSNLKIYVDGILSHTGSLGFIGTSNESQIGVKCTGANSTVCSLPFNGYIDEFAFFKRALTAAEVTRIYNRQNANLAGTFTSRIINAGGPVAWNGFSWVSRRPEGKELLGGLLNESLYTDSNVNMTGNQLLYHFSEPAGYNGTANEVVDSSGLGHQAKLFGGGNIQMQNGRLGFAPVFTGASQYLKSNSVFPLGGAFTLEFWMKVHSLGAVQRVAALGTADHRLAIEINTSGDLSAKVGDGTSWVDTVTKFAAISIGPWHHAAVTYDGTTAKFFLDGNPTASTTAGGQSFNNLEVCLGGDPGGLLFFNGMIDEAAVFNRVLPDIEIIEHGLRGALRNRLQVRSCSTANCAGSDFVGSDGSAVSGFSELGNSTASLPSFSLAGVTSVQQYFQYRVMMESDYPSYLSTLKSAGVLPNHYDAGGPTVVNNTGQSFYSVISFLQTLGGGNAGTVKYQVSKDGTTYYYFNGSAWTAAFGVGQTNTVAELTANFSTFSSAVGTGSLFFKAFLISASGTQPVELQRVSISGYH